MLLLIMDMPTRHVASIASCPVTAAAAAAATAAAASAANTVVAAAEAATAAAATATATTTAADTWNGSAIQLGRCLVWLVKNIPPLFCSSHLARSAEAAAQQPSSPPR